ncbi:hypothetical protein GX411_06045 [Candidatus Fermentibacteria bacterium]|nr:hypothetical protein [Candidatus Fermentibacteria bacterium]
MRISLVAALFLVITAGGLGLDPSDFTLYGPSQNPLHPVFSSAMSFSYTTGGGRSFATGAYTGTLGFMLHPGLTAEVELGYARIFDFSAPDAGVYLGGVGLDWRPSESLLLQFHMSGAVQGEAFDREF